MDCSLQAPLSMGFSRQGYPFPSPGDLPDSGIEPTSPALTGGFFTTDPLGKFCCYAYGCTNICSNLCFQFLRAYIQRWNYWAICRWFYAFFLRTCPTVPHSCLSILRSQQWYTVTVPAHHCQPFVFLFCFYMQLSFYHAAHLSFDILFAF